MTRMMTTITILLIIVFVVSCGDMVLDPASNPTNPLAGGGIRLTIEENVNKTLLPPLLMDITSYDIVGTGPDGAVFSELNVTESIITISNLVFGEWEIRIDGKNEDEIIIASGQASALVHTGQTTDVEILISPLSGAGALDITVNWQPEDVNMPSIWSVLVSAEGISVPLEFSLASGKATYTSENEFDTGYYTLIIKLLDNDILTMGAVEVVRIVKDQNTTGTFDFMEINKPGGQISVNITAHMESPIDITLTGGVATLSPPGSMQLTASVPEETGAVTFVWYINGESRDVGESFTVSALPRGSYNLNVTAFSIDGSRAGSTEHFFIVTELAENYNPLGVRQTAATSSSYTLAWNPWPGADSYNIYKNGTGGTSLLGALTGTELSRDELTRKGAFPSDGERIKVVPVIEGMEENLNLFYYFPVLYDQQELINSNFYDDFEDGVINPSYLLVNESINGTTQIFEQNGRMEHFGYFTDQIPYMYTVCDFTNYSTVTIRARLYLHRANDYHFMCIYLNYDMMCQPGQEYRNYEIIGMGHNVYDGLYGLVYRKTYINGAYVDEQLSPTEIYDQWFDFELTIDKTTNTLTIDYNDEIITAQSVNDYSYMNIVAFRIVNGAWWTGHYMYMDDFNIEFN